MGRLTVDLPDVDLTAASPFVAAIRSEVAGSAASVGVGTNVVRSMPERRPEVVAEPVRQGRTQELWQVLLTRVDDGTLVARGQVRLQNVPLPGV